MYDLIIIGAGPAGLSAALYASRAKLKTLIIEKGLVGGQIVGTNSVENYPGAPENTTGPSLIERMSEQAKEFGAERISEEVIELDLDSFPKLVKTNNKTYETKAIVMATGAKAKKIGVPGEEKLYGRGVAYCATCDGPFTEGQHAYVVGGGDAAVEEAIFLTKFAKKVTIIHRRNELRAAKSIQEKAFKNEKIDFIWDSEIVEIKGENTIESFIIRNLKTGQETEIKKAENENRLFIFVYIGLNPNSELLKGKIQLDNSYVKTNELMETEIAGLYAVGDLRKKSLRQVVTATSDGAIAAVEAEKYIEKLNENK